MAIRRGWHRGYAWRVIRAKISAWYVKIAKFRAWFVNSGFTVTRDSSLEMCVIREWLNLISWKVSLLLANSLWIVVAGNDSQKAGNAISETLYLKKPENMPDSLETSVFGARDGPPNNFYRATALRTKPLNLYSMPHTPLIFNWSST